MPMLVAGLLLLWLSTYLLGGFVKANPAVLARTVRRIGGWVALGFALFMMVRGEFNLAFGAALFGFWLLGTQPGWFSSLSGGGARRWAMGSSARAPRISRVRTATLEMDLDQDSGRVSGRCFMGPAAGRSLDELSEAESVGLHRWCESADPQSARLLETYLDRRFPRWREAGHAGGDPGAAGRGARRDQTAGMSEREAYQVLGLAQGADRDEVAQAHRRLMKKFHPDYGGSTAMAARLNEAKDVLMRRHP